jgi:hypothetical protein
MADKDSTDFQQSFNVNQASLYTVSRVRERQEKLQPQTPGL